MEAFLAFRPFWTGAAVVSSACGGIPEWMVIRHRRAPVGHGAFGIILCDLLCDLIEAFQRAYQKLCNRANARSKSKLTAGEQEVCMWAASQAFLRNRGLRLV